MQGIGAIAVFFFVIFLWRSIWVKRGNLKFWQLAANNPDVAFDWMQSRSDWIVIQTDDPKLNQLSESTEFVGPFKLAVPNIGGKVFIFAENKTIVESQKEFIDLFSGSKEQTGFPWLSSLSMIYPIVAMMESTYHEAPFLPILGYGFANLGYLLFVAGVFTGSFRALGLRYRIPTLIASVLVWGLGTLLCNL